MTTLLEYLNTNIKIDKKKEFPETPKVDDIRNFLTNQGFMEYKDATIDEFNNKLKTKRFTIRHAFDNSFCAIYFCNEGKVSENNLCFYLHATHNGDIYKEISWIGKIYTYTKNLKYIYNYDEFLDSVNNYFDWI